MFAIYNVQGRRFRNTLEQLRKIREMNASPRSSMRPDDGEQALQKLAEQAAGRTPADPTVSLKAQQAYREMLHVTERETVMHAYQLMIQPAITVPLELDIPVAWQRFREQPCHQLPVLDGQQRIAGMPSERDL